MTTRKTQIAILALGLAVLWAMPAMASEKKDAEEKIKAAMAVLRHIDKEQPEDRKVQIKLLKQARAVAIFPGMIKAGFIVGGTGGTGVLLARNKDGSWSPPAFLKIAGASVGLQIGVQSTDLMLVIMNQAGLQGIIKQNAKLGVDASVAAGPVGRRASAGVTGVSKKADVFSFSRSKGAFTGVSLEGAGLEFAASLNKAYYGRAVTLTQVLAGKGIKAPASAGKLISVLKKYAN